MVVAPALRGRQLGAVRAPTPGRRFARPRRAVSGIASLAPSRSSAIDQEVLRHDALTELGRELRSPSTSPAIAARATAAAISCSAA
jgi:hypothetical protein